MKCPNCGEPLDKNGCCKECGTYALEPLPVVVKPHIRVE